MSVNSTHGMGWDVYTGVRVNNVNQCLIAKDVHGTPSVHGTIV
jgi:hypothetical protein